MFDPFPFRFLNTIFSISGTILGSIILISSRKLQNQDRDKLSLDLELALKSEIRYSLLDEKLEQIVKGQEEVKKLLRGFVPKN